MPRHIPRNSLGQQWKPGDVWHCTDCGMYGDDRDDVDYPACPKVTHRNGPHYGLVLSVKEEAQ